MEAEENNRFFKITKHMKLTFRVDYLSLFRLWIYVSYKKIGDFRVHTGVMMSIFRGGVPELVPATEFE